MTVSAIYDVPAPAKLNLFLHVVGRRSDGYHLLESVFVLIDWCDTLHFECRNDGQLHRHDLGPALPADDLSLRAARALQSAAGCTLGADISVLKRVPWGAGLGGGSSDAASTLLALNRLWRLNWPRERLLSIALPLGADVPFFVGGHNALVQGIGEQLTPLPQGTPLPTRYAVIKPAASIATASIFGSPLLARNRKPAIVMSFLEDAKHRAALLGGLGCNDLQPAAQSVCAEVEQAASLLQAQFGNSRMSGSGSAVFSRIEKIAGNEGIPLANSGRPDAKASQQEEIQHLPAGWVSRICQGLDHHPLVGWAD
jgi:4-diphosphocytidyl-2-C-methyl-D-erythritol kinase